MKPRLVGGWCCSSAYRCCCSAACPSASAAAAAAVPGEQEATGLYDQMEEAVDAEHYGQAAKIKQALAAVEAADIVGGILQVRPAAVVHSSAPAVAAAAGTALVSIAAALL